MKTRYKILIIVAAVIVIIVVGFSILLNSINQTLEGLVNIEIIEPKLTEIPNGVYRGTNSAFPVKVVVDVEIQNARITKVKIVEHQQGMGLPAEVLADEIVSRQQVNLDCVAGATYSSRVILLAVRDALTL